MGDETGVSQEAKKWSELGASKGGKARAHVLTPEERSEIARQAVRVRWLKAGKLKELEASEEHSEVPDVVDEAEAKLRNYR